MELTIEQDRQMLECDKAHNRMIGGAMMAARSALNVACGQCWFRWHSGCRQKECAIWRMMDAAEKCNRLLVRGRLGTNCWQLAKEAKDISEVPFIG